MTTSCGKIFIVGSRELRPRTTQLLRHPLFDVFELVDVDVREAGLEQVLASIDERSCVIVGSSFLEADTTNILSILGIEGRSVCPIVVVTDQWDSHNVKELLEAGAQDVVTLNELTSEKLKHLIEVATERYKQASEAAARENLLHQREQRLGFALAASGGGAWEWDFKTDTAWWSDDMYPLFGVPSGTVMGLENSLALAHEDDRERLAWTVKKTIAERSVYFCEYRINHSSRGERWVQARGRVIFDSQGNAVRLQGVTVDITERKQSEERLRLSEERLRLATYFAEVGFWDVDMVNEKLTWPSSVKAMFGISSDRAVSMADFYAGLHPEDLVATTEAFLAACDPLQKAIYDVEYRTVGIEDGVTRWVAAKGRGIFDDQQRCTRVIGTAIDISTRRGAEQALRDSEARLRVLTENARVGLVVNGPDHRYRFVNQAYADILGLPSADIVGKHVSEILPSVYEEQVRPRLDLAFAGESVTYELVVPSSTYKDLRRYAVTYQPAQQSGGMPIVIVVIYDVTELKRAQEATEHASNLLSAFIEAVPGIVFAKNRDGQMLVANRGATELIGRPMQDFLGKTDAEFLNDPNQAAAIMETDLRIMNSGVTEQIEEDVQLADGTSAVFFSTKAPLRNHQNEVIGLISSSIDITARKKAESALRESESALRTVADAMPTLTWMAHADGWIFWYNKRWYEYTGTSVMDMAGWGWESVHDPECLPLVRERWMESISSGRPFEMTFPLRGADGVFRPFLTRAVPMHDADGRITRWFGSNTDVSPERAIQAKLEESESRLREADHRKDVFLATLAHELRNPLAPIRSSAAILAFPSLTNEQLVSAQQIIQRQVSHMALLLDDLLDVARITQDKLELKKERVSLLNVIDSAVEAVRPLIDRKRHRLTLDLPNDDVVILADALRLSQIISNLMANAAKYTDAEGSIILSARKETNKLEISVSDNGIGISANALPNLFIMFSQVAETTSRSDGGLGIGLALAKGLAAMHGGTLEAASPGLGYGSTFTFTLPLHVSPEEALSTKAEPIPIKNSRRVLIADDNEDAANTLAILVELMGHEVQVVYGGRAAISAAESFLPDVALIDLGMPDIDGCAVAKAIKNESWGSDVYLVALTGWGQEKDRLRTTAAGFHQHLTKPVDSAKIMALFPEAEARSNI
jgi:PAS domain S-box-containing protein